MMFSFLDKTQAPFPMNKIKIWAVWILLKVDSFYNQFPKTYNNQNVVQLENKQNMM